MNEEKYFLHRIQLENGEFAKGIEVHDSVEDAIRSFWGRMKLGFDNPQKPGMNFVSCKITDASGNVVKAYDMTWKRTGAELPEKVFMHHIRKTGETFSKDINICDTQDAAMVAYATELEYGYNNPRFTDVSFVSCEITDMNGASFMPETWAKAVEEGE